MEDQDGAEGADRRPRAEDAHEMIHKTPWTEADEDEVQGETELVTEMTEAEKEAERQFELEDKILARFYIRKVDLEKAWLHGELSRVQGGDGGEEGRRPSRSTRTRAEFASSRRWRTTNVRSTKRIEEYLVRKAEE